MRIGSFAEKELKDLVTDRVFIISVLLQFTIISALLFLYTFYSTINNTNLAVTVQIDKYDQELINRLMESGARVQVQTPEGIKVYGNLSGNRLNRVGRVNIAYNTSTNEVKSDASNIFSGYAISKIRDAADELSFDQALVSEKFSYTVEDVEDGNFAFLPISYGIIIPIALILPAFIIMGFTLQGILVERKTKVIELLLVSPISDFQIAQIKIVPYIFASTLLSILWLLLIGIRIEYQNFALLGLISFLFSMLIISISTIISCTASSVKEANALSSIFGMTVPMLGILPYNALSIYFPTAIMARIASSRVNDELLLTIGVFAIAAMACFVWAVNAIRKMRVNFS
ncbi:MAG: ABC transporter permease [Candidatus Micrarchaeota archaeon]